MKSFLFAFAVSALAATPPLPKVSGPVPVSAESAIFGAEDVPGVPGGIGLDSHRYIEEEYFISGSANLYDYDKEWNRKLKQSGIPYTTRVVIRRPKDPAKFSGSVQFECAHPQLHNTSSWRGMKNYFVRHGDIYAGLMCGADIPTRAVPTDRPPTATPWLLKWFDAKRYAAIHWPDDDGIRYDVISQVGLLLKSDRLLPGYKVERVYNSGWSFTGSQLRVYINEGFHEEHRMLDGKAIFDGYLIGISSSAQGGGYNPLSGDQRLAVGNPKRVTKSVDVPVIELMSENEAVYNTSPQAPESDAPGARHRLYEVPGLSHGDGLGERLNGQWHQLKLKNHPNAVVPPECDFPASDLPMGHLGAAALANLDLWVRKNVPPPHAPRVAVDFSTKLGLKDEFGSTKGGLRTAHLDVPLAGYGDFGKETRAACQAPGPYMRVRRVPLSKEQLRKLYRSKQDFLARFEARIKQLVEQRWLLAEDGRLEIEQARKAASVAFAQ